MKIQINTICELVALTLAILYYPYLKSSFMKWFLPFLALIFFGELVANYQTSILKIHAIGVNYLIAIIESLFYGYIFYNLGNNSLLRRLVILFVPLSITLYLITYLFCDAPLDYFFPNIVFSGFFLALLALTYLYLKFVDDEENLLISEPGFWIALGVCLFYSGVSISFSLHGMVKKNNLTLFGESLLNIVPRILSVILYLSISISIILCKPKKKIFS